MRALRRLVRQPHPLALHLAQPLIGPSPRLRERRWRRSQLGRKQLFRRRDTGVAGCPGRPRPGLRRWPLAEPASSPGSLSPLGLGPAAAVDAGPATG